MRKIHVHALAESDLIDIWQYSFGEWGEIQAEEDSASLNIVRVVAPERSAGGTVRVSPKD